MHPLFTRKKHHVRSDRRCGKSRRWCNMQRLKNYLCCELTLLLFFAAAWCSAATGTSSRARVVPCKIQTLQVVIPAHFFHSFLSVHHCPVTVTATVVALLRCYQVESYRHAQNSGYGGRPCGCTIKRCSVVQIQPTGGHGNVSCCSRHTSCCPPSAIVCRCL